MCKISELSTGKNINLNKTYHQHFPIKGGYQKGKNKEQINSPPYLHAILLFSNYLHVKNPNFRPTQYFPDSHYTLSSAPMTGLGSFTVGTKTYPLHIFCYIQYDISFDISKSIICKQCKKLADLYLHFC